MRKWVWSTLCLLATLAALTMGALAAPGDAGEVWVNGVQLELNAAKTEWTVIKYDGETEEIVIPALHDNMPVTKIASTAFSNGTIPNTLGRKLNKVTIPGTVQTVATKAFMGCDSLNTVTFQDYMTEKGIQRNASIEASAFEGCNGLTTLTLSSNIMEIKTAAFKDCKHLSGVVIPWGVKKVYQNAFQGCGDLRDITFLDPVVDIDKAFNLDSAILTSIHAIKGSELYGKLTTRMSAHPEKLHGLTGSTEPKVRVQASCTQTGIIDIAFSCSGYTKKETVKEKVKEIVEETVTKPDGSTEKVKVEKEVEKDVIKDVHYDCTYFNGKNSFSESRTTSRLPHKPEKVPDEPSSCTVPGYKNGTKCSVCSQMLSSVPEPLAPHAFTEDSKTIEKPLFSGHCSKDSAGTAGLTMITKKCEVCGYTPVCWECDKLIWELKKADDGLSKAREELAEATDRVNAAEADKEKADEEKEAAEKAYDDAETARGKADELHKKAQEKVTEAQAEVDGLDADPNATEEDKTAAKEALDKAKEAEAEAKKALQAAARTVLEKQIEKENAEKKAASADTELTNAETAKTDAQDKILNDTAVSAAQNALRTHMNGKAHEECAKCSELIAAISAAETPAEKQKAERVFEAHQKDADAHKPTAISSDAISGEDTAVPGHDWGAPEVPGNVTPPVCGSGDSILIEPKHTCKVCGKEELTGEKQIIDAADRHTPPAKTKVKEEVLPTCTEEGKRVYEDYECVTCHEEVKGEEEVLSALGHNMVHDPEQDIIKDATCTEPGSKTEVWVCSRGENCSAVKKPGDKPYTEERPSSEPIPAKGHDWGDFVPDPGQDATQAEDCHEKTATGAAKCTVCGVSSDKVTITIPGKMGHTWGEWKPYKEGQEIRKCQVCGKEQTRTATTPPGPDQPDPPGPDEPDPPGPDQPDPNKEYSITLVQGTGGTIKASHSAAKAGTTITVTVTPDSGYELDMIRVIGDTTAEDLTGTRRSFTMPASNVRIQVSFARIESEPGWGGTSSSGRGDPVRTQEVVPSQITPQSVPRAGAWGQVYLDIPTGHWAAGEIEWASQMGYMNGSGGRFDPDGAISAQQMWMVLARLNGVYPANMAEARRWATENAVADGSSPTGPVLRHQLVKALYRCANLTGRGTGRSNSNLAGYVDSRQVPAAAREPFIWAVSNGIVSGDSSKRLNPTATVTRAQFAVFLYRYSQRA